MYIIASTRGEKKKFSTELKYLCDQARPVVTIGQTLAHRHEELRQSTPLECDAFCLDRNNELTTWDFTLVQAWRSYQDEIQSIKPRVKVWFTFYDVRDLHWKTIRGKTKLTRKVKLRTVEFLVAGKAHRATFWSTSGFKKKANKKKKLWCLSILNRVGHYCCSHTTSPQGHHDGRDCVSLY